MILGIARDDVTQLFISGLEPAIGHYLWLLRRWARRDRQIETRPMHGAYTAIDVIFVNSKRIHVPDLRLPSQLQSITARFDTIPACDRQTLDRHTTTAYSALA